MQYLLLTLGHNAGACVVTSTGEIIGYEQERFDRIKASSAFPVDAISELQRMGLLNKDEETEVYITHWFDQLGADNLENSKYFNYDVLNSYLRNYSIITVTDKHTHHDAHAYSAVAFAKTHGYFEEAEDETHVLVVDGFGNRQEVISLYTLNEFKQPKLDGRVYGYDRSIGLMYQYATSFCGMSENKDEYKFLGYESYIKDIVPMDALAEFKKLLQEQATEFVATMVHGKQDRAQLPEHMGGISEFELINKGFLSQVKAQRHAQFQGWLNFLSTIEPTFGDPDEFCQRVVVGYGVQYITEAILAAIVKRHEIKNLITCGGVFYNVKLNNRLLRSVPGLYCTNPINGDQGCAIGLFAAYNPFHDLDFCGMAFGPKEDVGMIDADIERYVDPQFRDRVVFESAGSKKTQANIASLIKNNEIINIKRRKSEYGPRALCYTSTLALPTKENAEIINQLNNRNEVMPMAPVMLPSALERYYKEDQWNRVIGSDEYMIVTYHLNNDESTDTIDIGGVIHKDPEDDSILTSRPQIVHEYSDDFMYEILSIQHVPILINTSYNFHGEPIIHTDTNALSTFNRQCLNAERSGLKLPYLFILND